MPHKHPKTWIMVATLLQKISSTVNAFLGCPNPWVLRNCVHVQKKKPLPKLRHKKSCSPQKTTLLEPIRNMKQHKIQISLHPQETNTTAQKARRCGVLKKRGVRERCYDMSLCGGEIWVNGSNAFSLLEIGLKDTTRRARTKHRLWKKQLKWSVLWISIYIFVEFGRW